MTIADSGFCRKKPVRAEDDGKERIGGKDLISTRALETLKAITGAGRSWGYASNYDGWVNDVDQHAVKQPLMIPLAVTCPDLYARQVPLL